MQITCVTKKEVFYSFCLSKNPFEKKRALACSSRGQFLNKSGLETDFSSLITLATMVFSMLKITSGFKIFKKLSSDADSGNVSIIALEAHAVILNYLVVLHFPEPSQS